MNQHTMTPLARYHHDLATGHFLPDKAQEIAIAHLQNLYERLLQTQPLKKIKRALLRTSPTLKGLYLWGGVGRGKTYLMDIFFNSLAISDKKRTHFHHFMQDVHAKLIEVKGKKNPLKWVAKSIAKEARVLCFDEFFVSDIADAMLLGGLLEYLFEEGVTLVMTSNIAPDGLYQDGLQRERFLPAIDILKEHVDVIEIDGGIDYRLRVLEKAEIYHYPLDEKADDILTVSFEGLTHGVYVANVSLSVAGRAIAARYRAEGVVWFDFQALCDGPRSPTDYIQIAHEYHTVLLSNVPCLAKDKDDQMRRFISLVDEFYDRGVKLIISAATAPEALYGQGRLAFEFRRTLSRLVEMQSLDYLARPHKL
jgi:cell division protein ZapE